MARKKKKAGYKPDMIPVGSARLEHRAAQAEAEAKAKNLVTKAKRQPEKILQGVGGYSLEVVKEARKEEAKRELERRYLPQRERLLKFISTLFKTEKNHNFDVNWHYTLLEKYLERVLKGECTRLIINIPPRHGKTELITKCFPVWALGKDPTLQIIATGYSADLTQTFSGEARDYYKSETFKTIFPRAAEIREDQDTKSFWKTTRGGSYYATGTGGSITGRGANIFIIDDPIKPDEADVSELKRLSINNWFDNTVLSRLNNPLKDAVIIIMQRTHDNDLTGYLLDRMQEGTGEKWETVILPAMATQEDENRKTGEALFPARYPTEALEQLKQGMTAGTWSCQYQQEPIDKDSQEFYDEWFKRYSEVPAKGRVFTAVDPAFSKKTSADESAVITGKFIDDAMYVMQVSHGRWDPNELEDQIMYHIKKWKPEKVGIESIQAQAMIAFSLKNRLQKERLWTNVEELRQKGDKLTKIRRLVPLYRNGLIYHSKDMPDLEQQLLRFPRGKHDDLIDAEQMLYNLYEMQPNVRSFKKFRIEFNQYGQPIIK